MCFPTRVAQALKQPMGNDKSRELNQDINLVQANSKAGPSYPPLEKYFLQLWLYADASFSTNEELSSQLGYIILLCDATNKCHVIDCFSKKSRRVVRWIMASEVCAFMHSSEAAFTTVHDLNPMIGVDIPNYMFTDSKKLFDAMKKRQRTTERRLMLDKSSVRQSYKRFKRQAVGFVRGIHITADSMSRIEGNGEPSSVFSVL